MAKADLRRRLEKILEAVEETPGYEVTAGVNSLYIVKGPNGTISKLSTNLTQYRSLQAALWQLRNHVGWTPQLHEDHQERLGRGKIRERKRNRLNRQRAEEGEGQAGVSDDPATGNVAVLDKTDEEPADAIKKILEAIDFSAWFLAQEVLERARKAGKPESRDGKPGWLWRGDLFGIVRHLWPDVPDTHNHPDIVRIHTELVPYLRDTGLLCLKDARPEVGEPGSIWWVFDDSAEQEQPSQDQPTATASAVEPEDPMEIYVCGEPTMPDGVACPFADSSRAAVSIHRGQSAKNESHPYEGAFPCAKPGCHAVRATKHSMIVHLNKMHPLNGGVRCKWCFQEFEGLGPQRKHSCEQRPEGVAESSNGSAPERARVVPVEAAPVLAAPAVKPAPPAVPRVPLPRPPVRPVRPSTSSRADVIRAAMEILGDTEALMEENARLRSANEALADSLKEAQGKLAAAEADLRRLEAIRAALASSL